MSQLIEMPMINANEESAVIDEWVVGHDQPVSRGDLIAVVETTKSAEEVYSPESGFLKIICAEGIEPTPAGGWHSGQ